MIDIVKNIINIPNEIKQKNTETEMKQLELLSKKYEFYKKIKSSGITPEDLIAPLEALSAATSSLQAEPIILGNEETSILQKVSEVPEDSDIDEE